MTDESTYSYRGTIDNKVVMKSDHDFLEPLYERFGERFRRYRQEWDRTAQCEGRLPDFPLFLDIEPMYGCNLGCVTCPHKLGRDNPSHLKEVMTPQAFDAICSEGEAHGLPSCSVSNNNEGLMEKHLFDYLESVRKHGVMDVFLGTNALLLTRELSERLVDSALTRLLVSIDAATPETYARMRKNNRFDKVLRNVDDFLEVRANRGDGKLPLVRVSMVVTSLNEHEQEAFEAMWLGKADIISIQRYVSPWGVHDPDDPLLPSNMEPIGHNVCAALWQRMTIRPNGEVIACCHLSNQLKVGNLAQASIHEIWHGKAMQRLRDIHLSGGYQTIPVCKSCMM